jgi:hypothetical protein
MHVAHAWMLASVQGGDAPSPWYETVVIVTLIVLMALASWRIFVHLSRRERHPRPVADEWQALAVMGELCPHGWQAELKLYGWGAPIPSDAPPSRVPQVELEWKQFEEDSVHIAVARRVWAPSIGDALATMVRDRRTDMVLEEIERSAAEDADGWWEDPSG